MINKIIASVLPLLIFSQTVHASGPVACVTVRDIQTNTGNKIVRLSREWVGAPSEFDVISTSGSASDFEVIPTTPSALVTMQNAVVGDKVCIRGSAAIGAGPNIHDVFYFYAVIAQPAAK